MFVKALVLSLLAAPVLSSCMAADPDYNGKADDSGERFLANYQVYGKVSDESGTPIPGIMVVADYSVDVVYRADTLYTDKEGAFSKFLSSPVADKFYMSFIDIDGQANGGEFEPQHRYVTPVRTEFSSGYFGGAYIVSLEAKMKRKRK